MHPLTLVFQFASSLVAAGPDWLELIPPELRERRVPVPEEANAYPLWFQAIQRMGEETDQDRNEAIRETCREDSDFPQGEKGRMLEAWLNGNREALDLADRGLARGRFQFPEWMGEESYGEVVFPFFYPGSRLFEIRMIRAKLLASRGDLQGASAELRRLLRSSELLQDGGGSLLTYMAGSLRQSEALQALRWLARRRGVPASLLADLLPALRPDERELERPAECVRAEFSRFFLPATVGAVQEGADLRTMALAFGAGLEGKKKQDFVEGFCALLEGHPRPFDRKETVLLGAQALASCLQDLKAPWAERKPSSVSDFDDVARAWPEQLLPLQKGFEAEKAPLSADQLAGARKELLGIRNPVGKLLSIIAGPPTEGLKTRLFRLRAEREATRAVLALCIHAERFGRLPDTLEALVEKKILSSAPEDPFSGKPLGYSREKKLLWSVGSDGSEDARSGLRKADGSRREGVFEVPAPD